jgi:NADPH:quinone reductase-like Zn-dependent oxidoreductase
MKALVATDHGPPEKVLRVTDVPEPVPGEGQVLVRTAAAALNPFDLKLITGELREMIPISHPFVVGMDAAGTVAAVGDGVTAYVEGDPVFGYSGLTAGTVAEYTVIPAGAELARRPDGLDPVRAAAIPESGMTALHLLRATELKPGQRVLVIGATGGIGMFLVQLAAAEGTEVVATATPEDVEYVRNLGATAVVDYTKGDIAEQTLALYPDAVDVVFDLVDAGPDLARSAVAAKPGGRVVSPLGGPSRFDRDVMAVYIGTMTPQLGDLDDLAAMALRGLRIEIGATYPLDDAVRAVIDFTTRHTRGKVVVTI